jgi:hypothetical protein
MNHDAICGTIFLIPRPAKSRIEGLFIRAYYLEIFGLKHRRNGFVISRQPVIRAVFLKDITHGGKLL